MYPYAVNALSFRSTPSYTIPPYMGRYKIQLRSANKGERLSLTSVFAGSPEYGPLLRSVQYHSLASPSYSFIFPSQPDNSSFGWPPFNKSTTHQYDILSIYTGDASSRSDSVCHERMCWHPTSSTCNLKSSSFPSKNTFRMCCQRQLA